MITTHQHKIISKLARQFLPSFKKMGKAIDDLKQDGYLVLQELKTPTNCSIETALAIQLKQKWLNELKHFKRQKVGSQFEHIPIDEVKSDLSLSYDPKEKLDTFLSLRQELQDTVQLIIDAPDDFVLLLKTMDIKKAIIKYFQQKGWEKEKIKQLKIALKLY